MPRKFYSFGADLGSPEFERAVKSVLELRGIMPDEWKRQQAEARRIMITEMEDAFTYANGPVNCRCTPDSFTTKKGIEVEWERVPDPEKPIALLNP